MTAGGVLGLFLLLPAGATPREATDEILRVVPQNCAACLVVEDLAGHVKRWPQSKLGKKVLGLPYVAMLTSGDALLKFGQFEAAFQSVTGVGAAQMRDDVLGVSVVLAYYAGANPAEDAGAFFCRAANEETLDRLLKGLSTGGDGEKGTALEHAGVKYWRRPNGQGRHHFWMKLGSIGVWTDKEAAIRAIIETANAGAGVGGQPVFAAMRSATPPGAFLQLLVDPRGLDARMAPPKGNPLELAINRRMQSVWRSLRWSAWTISLEPEPEMSWFWALDRNRLPADLQEKPQKSESVIPPTSNVPEVLAAFATTLDVESLKAAASGILNDAGNPPEFAVVENVARQFLMGLDPANGVLPSVGPSLGASLSAGRGIMPEALIAIQLQEKTADKPGAPLVPDVIEQAMHFMMVVAGLESNKSSGDACEVRVRVADGRRIHYLSGSRRLPSGMEPGFVISSGWLFLGTSSSVLEAAMKAKALPGEAPMLIIDAKAIVRYLEAKREPLTALVGPEAYRFGVAVASAGDRIVLSSRSQKDVHFWQLKASLSSP